ncbi:Telomerase ribonucleoprotein complex RNA binding domain-containing protein [Lipomyces kononenkoae]
MSVFRFGREVNGELIAEEFVYWLFDSLIPSIVRGHFFVTDSATTRNRLVYFRHDVWHRLSQPALNKITSTMFDEVPMKLLTTIADDKTRRLGFAAIRLLPKATGVRLIMRLNKKGLRKSVNKQALGSTIQSPSDALPKLLAFQQSLKDQGVLGRKLYFVKVDIQSCFDSIPPAQAYRAAKKFFRLNEYRIRQFITVSMRNNNVFKKFISAAYSGPLEDSVELELDPMENSDFALFLKRIGKNFEKKVFIDDANVSFYDRQELLRLLVEHIAGHIVKLERENLGFTSNMKESVLLRMTDDFLYITLDRDKAVKFFRNMVNGYPEYGATINAAKSLTNFNLNMLHLDVPCLTATSEFPYCDVSGIQTIEYSYRPSESFMSRMLTHIPILLNRLYGNSALNSHKTILINIHRTFVDIAMRYASYVRQLKKFGSKLSWLCMKDTIEEVIRCILSTASRVGATVSLDEVYGLGCAAFMAVLRRKQSSFRNVLLWLESMQQAQSKDIRAMVANVAMDEQSRCIISVKKY